MDSQRTEIKDHRPYAAPTRAHAMSMRWVDLAFLHWPVSPESLAPHIPAPLELDCTNGEAWLGVVPFRMEAVRPRGVPSAPWLSAFPEINLRTYVTYGGRPGVWFFSLDVTQPLAVWAARRFFHLPYFRAQMSVRADGARIQYRHERNSDTAPPAAFHGDYAATGPVALAKPGSLEHWLTERYCLYAQSARGHVYRGEIHHSPWPLQPAEVELKQQDMFAQIGLPEPTTPPWVHFAKRLDVVAWLPELIK